MISAQNYFDKIDRIDVNNLPETLRKSHAFVLKSTNNGSTWEIFENNETIHNVINLYFKKLDEYLSSKDSKVPSTYLQPKEISRSKKETRARTEEKVKIKTKSKRTPALKAIKKVEYIREEVKFIRRFVRLHNKIKSPVSILSLIKSLQRSIIQKLVRKTSPLAGELRMIQDKLVNAYNSSKGKDLKIEINDKDLPRLVFIAGGEQVYPSINIIKRYVSLQGKEIDHKKLESFTKHIESVFDKKKVAGDDPYYDKVKTIHNTIKKLKAGDSVHIANAELNGLEGVVAACSCRKSVKERNTLRSTKRGKHVNTGKKSHNVGLNGVLTAEEMANRTLDVLNFASIWLALLGEPAKNFTAMFHGEPHNGKTIFLLKLGQYLAENFGEVLYVSSEEFASPTMTKKVGQFLNPLPKRLHFTENLKDPDLSEYQFIILDSVNDLGSKINDYKQLRKDYPASAFIFILQHTKAGEFRGGKDWEHIAEIVGEVDKGSATITKNRYAPKATLDFFKHFGIRWQEPPVAATEE